jgi:2-haloacid dehalogenase
LWFTTLLQYAMAMSLAGRHAPLPEIGAAVLRMLAEGKGIALTPAQAGAALRPRACLSAFRFSV